MVGYPTTPAPSHRPSRKLSGSIAGWRPGTGPMSALSMTTSLGPPGRPPSGSPEPHHQQSAAGGDGRAGHGEHDSGEVGSHGGSLRGSPALTLAARQTCPTDEP